MEQQGGRVTSSAMVGFIIGCGCGLVVGLFTMAAALHDEMADYE